MPDLLTHYASSVLVARTKLGLKKSLLLGLAGLLPDIDILLHVHRWVTHSFILAIAVATPLLTLTYKYRRSFEAVALAATIYLLHSARPVYRTYTNTLPTSKLPIHKARDKRTIQQHRHSTNTKSNSRDVETRLHTTTSS